MVPMKGIVTSNRALINTRVLYISSEYKLPMLYADTYQNTIPMQ